MRPKLELLSQEQVTGIVGDALLTLERVGMFVECDDALALAKDAGLRTDGDRVFFTEASVRGALESAPAVIKVYDRDGAEALHLGGDVVQFDPGSAALHVLDAETRRRRAPSTSDCVRLAWVAEACKYIAAQSTGLIPTDVPKDMADRYRLYVALLNSRKPVVTGTFLKDGFTVMRKMLQAVRGGEQALRDKPLAIFDCAPTPPLKWSDLTCQALIDCARCGIPAELVSMPMAGATSPVTLRDVVVQHCAECMCGVVLHQLARPGAPIVWGGSPSALDMRFGTTPMGAIETQMIDAAYAQVGKHLGMPTHAYMALSDAKTADWQAGMESGNGATLAALAGINMVSGPGMLDFESCQSLEKLVLDNEACGIALRLVRGIEDHPGQSAPELLGAVVEAGHFLANPHTRKHFRTELHIPGPAIDRATYGEWEKQGARSAFDAARAQVDKIVAKGNPAPPSEELRQELTGLMSAEARRFGMDALPGQA
jgi:trimethylamine--corrinoid protein Co-methyltransferase